MDLAGDLARIAKIDRLSGDDFLSDSRGLQAEYLWAWANLIMAGVDGAIALDMYVEPRQRVFLVLNHTTKGNTGTQIFRASRPVTQRLEFPVKGLEAGDYLLRVQVDGAESPLQLNEQKHYSGPIITVG